MKKTGREKKKKKKHQPFKENETPGQNGKFTRGWCKTFKKERDLHDKETIDWFEVAEELRTRRWRKNGRKRFLSITPQRLKIYRIEKRYEYKGIKKRSDPNVAPDEPVPLRLRPWNQCTRKMRRM